VHVGASSSVWCGAVVRGDVHPIRIGARVNVQDGAVIHVTSGRHATHIGDDVTIGHMAVLHGCTVAPRALIGMGAIILDGAVIGEEAMVAAGALVPPGKVIPPRTLAVGEPAKVARELSADELARVRSSGAHYAELAAEYAREERGENGAEHGGVPARGEGP
jgi:carbonic anhydrase/acetyltransferase-like protein (isoleucine patch superfamily)